MKLTAALLFCAITGSGLAAPIIQTGYTKTVHHSPGDVDGDGRVTVADVILVLQINTRTQTEYDAADVNHDGILGEDDLRLMLKLAVNQTQPVISSRTIKVDWGNFSSITEAPDGHLVVLGDNLSLADPRTGAVLASYPLPLENQGGVFPVWVGGHLYAIRPDGSAVFGWGRLDQTPSAIKPRFDNPCYEITAFDNWLWESCMANGEALMIYDPAEAQYIGTFTWFSSYTSNINAHTEKLGLFTPDTSAQVLYASDMNNIDELSRRVSGRLDIFAFSLADYAEERGFQFIGRLRFRLEDTWVTQMVLAKSSATTGPSLLLITQNARLAAVWRLDVRSEEMTPVPLPVGQTPRYLVARQAGGAYVVSEDTAGNQWLSLVDAQRTVAVDTR